MEVIDIDITARYKAETAEIAKTEKAIDKVTAAEKEAEKEAEKLEKKVKVIGTTGNKAFTTGANSIAKFESKLGSAASRMEAFGNKADRINNKLHSIGSKTITVPVKIADYATAPLRNIINYATSLKGIVMGIATGVAANKLIMNPVNAADTIESSRIFFETKLGGKDAADNMIAQIQEFDKKSPFNSTQIIGITQSMLAMGFEAENVINRLGIIGDTAAALGRGTEGVEGIARALGEMKMKGTLGGQEFLQLTNWGVGGKEYVMRAFGKSYEEVNKDIEAGLLTIDEAINGMLAEMEKDYGGAAAANADRTVSGILGQVQSLVETKIQLPWGEGLAEGFKDGLTALNELLDVNEEGLDKIGLKLKRFGSELSIGFVGMIERGYSRLDTAMDSDAFKQADTSGKIGIVWDEVIAEPFGEWWSSTGSAWAESAAEKMGKAFAVGMKTAFIAAFKELPSDAATMLPGGKETSNTAGFSALILGALGLKGASLLGKGGAAIGKMLGAGGALGSGGALAKAMGVGGGMTGLQGLGLNLGMLGAKLGSGAATGAGLIGAGAASVGGGIAGLIGALNGLKDILNGKTWRGGTKLGMVGAGAAAGAGIGSFFGGIGAVPGALIGAGVGGLGALFKGSAVGDWLEEKFSGAGDAAQISDGQIRHLGVSANVAAGALAALRLQATGIQANSPGALRGAANRGRGYASGTNSATAGWHMVGEQGPELLHFNGGEQVLNANRTKDILSGSTVEINLGGVSITVTGSYDLKENIEPIANELCVVIADKMQKIFQNKTVTA